MQNLFESIIFYSKTIQKVSLSTSFISTQNPFFHVLRVIVGAEYLSPEHKYLCLKSPLLFVFKPLHCLYSSHFTGRSKLFTGEGGSAVCNTDTDSELQYFSTHYCFARLFLSQYSLQRTVQSLVSAYKPITMGSKLRHKLTCN